jgi:hypothetical protein
MSPEAVTPAKAGAYDPIEMAGSPPAGDDERITSKTSKELIFSSHVKVNEETI